MVSRAEYSGHASRGRRVVMFPLVRMLLAAAMLLAGVAVVQSLAIGPIRASASLGSPAALFWQVLYLLGSVAIGLGTYAIYVRLMERRRADEIALAGSAGVLAGGVLLGGALFAAVLALQWLAGTLRASFAPGSQILVGALVVNTTGAVVEEMLLRCILFRMVEEQLGTWLALAVSALAFGLLHGGDAPMAMVLVGLAGGLLPSAAYALTRRAWLPIGLHAGWDTLQDLVFGLTFAGHSLGGLLHVRLAGPDLLTGGSAGPEGSVAALIVCLAASAYLLLRASRRGQILPPFWRRGSASLMRFDGQNR